MIAGCESCTETEAKNSEVKVDGYNYEFHTFTLPDGTPCVALKPSFKVRGISCDWNYQKLNKGNSNE